MTIGKPGKNSSTRSFRSKLADRLGLTSDSGGRRRRGGRSASARERRASIERRLQSQSLEPRQLLAGPELIGVQPNSGELLYNSSSIESTSLFGTSLLTTSPNELRFQFDDNSEIDVATLLNSVPANSDSVSPRGLSISRAGSDGGFETATAMTDFGTSVNAISMNRVEVEFRATAPGVEGNGTKVEIFSVNESLATAPVKILPADPNNPKLVRIQLNNNFANANNTNGKRPATTRDLIEALDNQPAGQRRVTAYSANGSTLAPISNKLGGNSVVLTLDGANAARAFTDLGLGAQTKIRFQANQSGASGTAISVKVTAANLGASSTPLVSVSNNVINVRINSAPGAQTTVAEFLSAINANPTAANLITASLLRGNLSAPIPPSFTTVSTSTPNGLRLSGASDTVLTPGYVGLGDLPNEVVFRFAEPLPDDIYQIEVYGSGDRALKDTDGQAFNDGKDKAFQFKIDAPPRVLAVVPEPVSKVNGRLISEPNVIEVYFTNDVNSSVLNKDYYTTVFTRDTVTGDDDVVRKPISVEPLGNRTDAVRVVFASPFSRTPDPANPGSFIQGAVRFRVGNDTLLPAAPEQVDVSGIDAGDSYVASPNQPGPIDVTAKFNGNNLNQTTSVRITGGEIKSSTTNPFEFQFPGGTDYQGVRDIRPDDPTRNDRVVPLGIWRRDGDTTPGISTIYYNFPDSWQGEDFGTADVDLNETYFNAITNQQRQRVREVASLFSEYLGVQFIEVGQDAAAAISSPNFAGAPGPVFSIGVGELASTYDGSTVPVNSGTGGVTVATRRLDDQGKTFLPFDVDPVPQNANRLIVLDGQDFDQSTDDFTGGEFFRGVFLGVGQLLGYGYADHLPQPITQSTGSVLDAFTPIQDQIPATTNQLLEPNEPAYPSPADIVNGQFLYRPESNDIDMYKFTLANKGTLNISAIAQRLSSSSTLDTLLRLYRLENNIPVEIAANDDYFSNDSMIELEVEAGTYFIGVSASGNDAYNPIISGTGIGGVTEGDYEIAMTFTPSTLVGNAISDGVNVLDGDADGEQGGLFQFWFEPNDANKTVYVDNTYSAAATGTPGSITNPFRTLKEAFNRVETQRNGANPVEVVRVVGSAAGATQPVYRIGTTQFGAPLTNGELTSINVPKDVNLVLDAGVRFEMSKSRIGVGSTSASGDRSGSSIQLFGTPDNPVQMVGFGANPAKGTWGGIDIRGDIDFADDSRVNMENNGVFLNHIQYADIRHGGGIVSVDGVPRKVSAIELAETRATIINNVITLSADAAISATPDTFAETRFDEARFQNEIAAGAQASEYFTSDFVRVGPHIRGNTILNNTYNGLLIRINTPPGGSTETLNVNARFDDTDIVHILTENLLIEGKPGGQLSLSDGPSLLLTQATPLVNTPAARVGDIAGGEYAYRMTYVTRDGFESVASDASLSVTLTATGAIRLNNLPAVSAGDEFTGRRLYRAPVIGTNPDGSPIYGEFMRVARLNTSDTTYIDRLDAGVTPLDPERVGPASLALSGRLDPGLTIDPGTIVKLNGARIDVTFGARLFAEGTVENPVVMTGLNDRRYGTGGTFNTNGLFTDSTPGARAEVHSGDWSGIFAGFGADVSIDHAVIAGGGGTSRIEGGFASFNVIESHQSNLRVAHTRFEFNDDGRSFLNDSGNNINNPDDPREQRVGRANNASGTIFVRASQPVLIDNTFVGGNGPVMSFDVNSFTWQEQTDYGRSTGGLDALQLRGNSGPLIRGNRINTDGSNDGGLAGLEVRGGKVATEVVWDDTDIVHIVRDQIEVPNQHIYGGLRIQSDARGSLVVKFDTRGDVPEQSIFVSGHTTDTLPEDLPRPGDANFVSIQSLNEPGEFTSVTPGVAGDIDFGFEAGDDFIEVTILQPTSGTFTDTTFNGLQISPEFDLGGFDNATLDVSGTTLAGFDRSRLLIIDGMLFLNTAGLSYNPSDVIRINTGTIFPVVDVPFQPDPLLRQRAGIVVGGNTYTAEDQLIDIADRIGGSLQIIGMPDFPVVLTALGDDAAGAGFTPDGRANLDTDNNGLVSNQQPGGAGRPGSWAGIVIREAASDSNVSITRENEPANVGNSDTNAIASRSQYVGELAPDRASGDENRRIGLIVEGELSSRSDVDVYSFVAEGGTQVWIDIDRTDLSLDTVVELVNANGQTLVLSDDAAREAMEIEQLLSLDAADPATAALRAELLEKIGSRTGRGAQSLGVDAIFGLATGQIDAGLGLAAFQDNYSINPRDAGMRVILPGVIGQRTLYHVRVRSAVSPRLKDTLTPDGKNPMVVGNTDNVVDDETTLRNQNGALRDGLTSGSYQLQVRIKEQDVFAGTQIRYSDVLYADNGVQILGGPMHSPLTGEDYENNTDRDGDATTNNNVLANAQRLGLYDTQFTNDPALAANQIVLPDGSILLQRDSQGVNRVDVALNNGAGPLSSDRLAKNISGFIENIDDVDWYQFEIEYQQLTRDDAEMYLATVFDLDYADGASRADLQLYVFDSQGRLILIGGDSNIADDRSSNTSTGDPDLSRGSFGSADPYIGSAELPEGTYYVAIANKFRGPAVLDQFTTRDATNPLIRLEPIDSTIRIAEEGFNNLGGQSFYSQVADGPVLPVLFDNNSIIDHTLDDVFLYVNSASGLFLVNPFTGARYANLGGFGTQIRDIAFTANGELFGYTVPPQLDDGNYTYARIDTVDATLTLLENTGIATFQDQEIEDGVQILDADSDDGLIVEAITIRSRFGNESGFLVANRPGFRPGLGPGPGGTRRGYTSNILYAFDHTTGEATGPNFNLTANNAGAGTDVREIGQIDTNTDPDNAPQPDANVLGVSEATGVNAAGVNVPKLFDGDTFTLTNGTQFVTFELNQGYTIIANNPSTLANGTTLQVTAPGQGTTTFELTNAANPTVPGNIVVPIDRTASSTVFIERLASAIRQRGIAVSFEGTQLAFPTATNVDLTQPSASPVTGLTLRGSNLVQPGNVPVTLVPTDSAETIVNRIIQAIAQQNASGALPTVIGTSLGRALRVTGVVVNANSQLGNLRLGGYANGGTITGVEIVNNDLYAVSNRGGLYRVPSSALGFNGNAGSNNDVGIYIASATDLIGINFSGLRAGPNSLRDAQGRQILFGITANGTIHAFNLDGELQPVFAGGRTSISTGISNAQGLDFSTLDFNLWHVTNARGDDPGHGINEPFHRARPDQQGGNSLAFNYTDFAFNNRFAPGEQPVSNRNTANENVRQDGQQVHNTYNFPGGARGQVQSNAFSLEGYSADDQPTMYFNYFLATDGVDEEFDENGDPIISLLRKKQDSLRIYVVDGNGVEHLVATNNEARRDRLFDDEFDDPAKSGIYDDNIDVDVQQLFDNTGTWRQARVPLGPFAGQSGLSLRIEFATAGTTSTLTGEIRVVGADKLTEGETVIINGEVFKIDFAPEITFSSGSSLARLYNDPNAISSFTVDGQQYVLDDGSRAIPAGAIAINVLADQPAGATLNDLTAGDIARAVAAQFDRQVALTRVLPSGTEIEQFYDANPIPIGVDPAAYYAENPDKLFTIYLAGRTYVLLDGDTQREDMQPIFDTALSTTRRPVYVFDQYQTFIADPRATTGPESLDELSEEEVSAVIGRLIGEQDLAVDYAQLVPTANVLDNYYADPDVSFVVTIDGVEYVLNDGSRTIGPGQISVPLGTDVTRVNIAGELQAIVEANTGLQPPKFQVHTPPVNFSDASDPVDPFGNPNTGGVQGRNDLTYQATPLPYNGGNLIIAGRGTLGTITPTLITNRGDVDLLSVDNVVAGTTITVDVTADQPGVENNVRFFDSDGIELTAANGGLLATKNVVAGTISVVVPSDGSYFIGISGPENGTYDPRIAGTTDAAQTGGYAATITLETALNITAQDGKVEFDGATRVSVGTNSGLAVNNVTDLGNANSIRVNRNDSPAEVAEAFQRALANRFTAGDSSLIPRLGSAVRVPTLQFDPAQLGPFVSTSERYGDRFGGNYQSGAADNAHEGAYIDDIIIGFAERGELVTNATPIDPNEEFVDTGELGLTLPAERPRPTNSGSYQLEIRDASEYIASGFVPNDETRAVEARFRAFDTNDRLVSDGITLATKPASEILDGATFTIGGKKNRVTFEFDIRNAAGVSNGIAPNANRVAVTLNADATAEQVADAIIAKINSQQVRSLLGVDATRANLTHRGNANSVPDKRVNLSGATSIRTNDRGVNAFESTVSPELRGDANRDRIEQGVIMIENSRFIYNADKGMQISRDASEAVLSNDPLDATPTVLTYARNFFETNTQNLIPGVVVRNNTFAFNQNVGLDIRGLEGGGLASENPIGFDRIVNNTLFGGTVTLSTGLGSQIFDSTFFPMGGISFADRVLDSKTILGPDVEQSFTDSETALGSPDCSGVSATDPQDGSCSFSLGTGGQAVFVFEDNLLTGSSSNPSSLLGSGDGIADLVIYEAGIPERVRVEISRDGVTYFYVGEVFGLDNTIDLDAYGFGLNDRFSYVRLTDLGTSSGSNTFGPAGADIDAVGAISTVPRDQFIPGSTGIQVEDNAAPTLLNNVISNFQVGLSVAPTPLVVTGGVDDSSSLTVIGGTTFYRNTTNSRIAGMDGVGVEAQFIDPSDQLFVDPYNLIFTPQSRTRIIDSGIASLPDRASLITLRNSLGLPVSPILAPLYDANGQLRVDDPTFSTEFGTGLSGFIDRGAEERTDNEGPRFVLTTPRGQDLIFGNNEDLFGRAITQGTIYDAFEIQLIDGIRPADTGYGVGINDNTVTSDNLLVTRLVTGSANVETLVEGRDYRFAYEPTDNTIRITPIAGIWADNAVYTIEFLGIESSSVDGFTAVLRAETGLDYGDGEKTFIDGQVLETELGIQLSVPASALLTTDPITGISRPTITGQTVTIADGLHAPVTFEFVTDIFEQINSNDPNNPFDDTVAVSGNYAIRLPSTATPQRISQLLAQAINGLAASKPNVLDIEAVFPNATGTSAGNTGRLQLLGTPTNPNSELAYVVLAEDSVFRQVNQELDLRLLPDTTLDFDGTRLTNYDESILVFDGTREILFEFDSDGIQNVVGPNVNRVILPVAPDASPRALVQTLIAGFQTAGLNVQASGASGVMRIRGTNGPISVISLGEGALVTGNSSIGVDPGFGLQIPLAEGQLSFAVQDGQTFTIARGLSTPVTFELDFDGNLNDPNAVPVASFGSRFGGSPDQLGAAIVAAISANFPSLSPAYLGGGRITLSGDSDIRINTNATVIEGVGSPGDPASQPVVIRYNDDTRTVAAAFATAAQNALGGSNVELNGSRVLLKTSGTPRGDGIVTDFIADKAGNRLQGGSERVSSRVEILVGDVNDYGDASLMYRDSTGVLKPYPTTIQAGGPSHLIVNRDDDALFLGATVTPDVNGVNDDGDLDDGVVQLGVLKPGSVTNFEISTNQGNGTPLPQKPSFLDIWFDWNHDGVFQANEGTHFTYPANNPFLINTIPIHVPATAQVGDVQARFRLSYGAVDPVTLERVQAGPLGAVDAGEVEDYVFTVANNPYTAPSDREDVNASGAVTPLDALLIINVLNANNGPVDLSNPPVGLALPAFPDVNSDGMITALDALLVINRLNRTYGPGSEPSGEAIQSTTDRSLHYRPVADGVLATNATIVLDPTTTMSPLASATNSSSPLGSVYESSSVSTVIDPAAGKTSVFDSPVSVQLDTIVDTLAQDRQDAKPSDSDDGFSALDEFFAAME